MEFGVANIFHVNVTRQQKCREYEEVCVHVLNILLIVNDVCLTYTLEYEEVNEGHLKD